MFDCQRRFKRTSAAILPKKRDQPVGGSTDGRMVASRLGAHDFIPFMTDVFNCSVQQHGERRSVADLLKFGEEIRLAGVGKRARGSVLASPPGALCRVLKQFRQVARTDRLREVMIKPSSNGLAAIFLECLCCQGRHHDIAARAARFRIAATARLQDKKGIWISRMIR